MNTDTPKILIVKLSAIGDVVHTLPTLNALRKHYPRAHITWLVEEAASAMVEGHPALDRVLVSKRKTWIAGLRTPQRCMHIRQMFAFLRRLRDTRYDLILDFQAAVKGAVLIALARGGRKIGFGPGMEHQEHSYLVLNEKIPMVSMEIHALERGLLMLDAIGVPHQEIQYNLPIGKNARAKTDQFIDMLPGKGKQLLIAINPMAKWESKLWPMERFSTLADHLIDRYDARIFFTGSPSDRPLLDRITGAMRRQAFNIAGQTSLIELAALYSRMTLVVSTDTGPMHIAAAVDTPVVALFGPTAQWRTGPFGSKHRVVSARQGCGPCFKRICPKSPSCMQAITVDAVLRQIDRMLA